MLNPLEEYLKQLRSQLKGLPNEQREAEVEEARQHLVALIQKCIEAGDSQEVAVSIAVQQFGSPQENGRELRSAWKRASSVRLERFLSSSHFVLAVLLGYSAIINAWEYFSLPFRFLPYFVKVFDFFPTTMYFRDWESNPLGWLGVCGLFGVFSVFSLFCKKQMRTTFFFVFVVLTMSRIAMDSVTFYSFSPHLLPIEYMLKIATLTLSVFCLCVSLRRDKSLFAPPLQRRTA